MQVTFDKYLIIIEITLSGGFNFTVTVKRSTSGEPPKMAVENAEEVPFNGALPKLRSEKADF